MMDSAGWNNHDHGMHHGPDDDFQQFLDMNSIGNLGDGLQFDFDFQNQNNAHMMQVTPRDPTDTPMSGTDGLMAAAMHPQMPNMTTSPAHPSIPSTLMAPQHAPNDAISDIDAQIQFLQQQKLQQQQRQMEQQQVAFFAQQHNRMVPPTPQSLEIQAGNQQQFYAHPEHTPQQHQDMYDGYRRMKEQQDVSDLSPHTQSCLVANLAQMSFTPLVSPAVTPLESHFPMEQPFAVPNAYFSPLTSPALHAQPDPMAMFDRGLAGAGTSSPEGMDLEGNPPSAPPTNAAETARKSRKTNAAKVRAKPNVGKSPITKPQRKKTGSTPLLNARLTELTESAGPQHPRAKQARRTEPSSNASNSSAAGITDSENDSVSPEALSDMPPPPIPTKPRSAKPSPALMPQNHDTPKMGPTLASRPGKPSPATPASLMKLPSPANANMPDAGVDNDPMAVENIENFELPEAVSSVQKPALAPLITKSQSPNVRSPALESASGRNSAFQPLPSPVFPKSGATTATAQSPLLASGSSATTPSAKKTPLLAARGSKKRGSMSMSSSHVSPALLPRISPNIKPLLPGGMTAEDTASRLLASKSNYQNILEGNLVPGVSYPSELSTNLTSKRTSHKIAEQGRRNRINSALQEIATLLPLGTIIEGKDSGGESGDKKDKNGVTPNSKASTVEMAIEYIKQLKQEVLDANKRAEEAEKKLQDKEATTSS